MLDPVENINQLILNLTQLKDLVQQVLTLEEKKYEIIKNMDMDQLIYINEEESALIHKIDSLEYKRNEIVNNLIDKGQNNDQISLFNLVKLLPEEHQQTISLLSDDLKTVCHKLTIEKERNEFVLKNSAEVIEQILSIVQGSPQDSYNSQGMTTEMKQQSIHMLDQLI